MMGRNRQDFRPAMLPPDGSKDTPGSGSKFEHVSQTNEQKQIMSTPKSVIDSARKQGAKMVDVKFVDTFGTWQHFSVPISELTEDVFDDGFGFDGSSIRGWKSIEASDMLAMPDPATAFIDPFCAVPTLSLTCTIAETGTKEAYTRDPRGLAQRAESNIANPPAWPTQPCSGPEAEFFIFDNVQFDSKSQRHFLFGGFGGGHLEYGPRGSSQPWLQNPPQGRVFPGPAERHPAGHPHRNVPDHGATRHRRSSASITKWLPAARLKLTFGLTPWSRRPTT